MSLKPGCERGRMDFHILYKYKFLITSVMVIIMLPPVLFVSLAKPVFRSVSIMVVEEEESRSPLTGERLSYDSYLAQSLTFKTHFQLIKSQPVMELVIRDLELDRLDRERGLDADTMTKIRSWLKLKIRLLRGTGEKKFSPRERLVLLVEKLQEKITIANVKNSRLLNIIVEDIDPVVAVNIGNSLGRVYIDFDIDTRLQYPLNRLSLMRDQLGKTRKKLEDAEAEFLEYKEQNNIFSIEGKQKIISQKIEEFNDAYVETRNKRLELDAKLNQLKMLTKNPFSEDKILNFRSLIENPMIDNLYNQLLDAEIELSRIIKVYKSKHPKTIQIRTRIDNTRKKLDNELAKELENMKAKRSVLRAREKVMLKTISEFETDAKKLNKKELGYIILRRNVETNQKLYDTLLSKMKEMDTIGNINVTNIRISQKATASPDPVWPNKKMILIVSAVFGLMTGAGIAFFLAYLRQSLHAEDDVQKHLELPVLSVIPVFKKTWMKPGKKSKHLKSQLPSGYLSNPVVAESYRYLKTNILLAFYEKGFRTLLISSAGKKEGKTTSVVYLAQAISQAGRSVLIIDANLHNPGIDQVFFSQGLPGLAELLINFINKGMDDESEKQFCLHENIDSFIMKIKTNLYLLPAGNVPHTPHDLMDSEGVPILLSDLKEKFDILLIDAPPILSSSDALILGAQSDGTLLVVKADFIKRQMVSKAVERLRACGVNLLGAVLNQADVKSL